VKKIAKKDQETRRLTLHRETIQNLQPELLELALGGLATTTQTQLDPS
jgi:hypothetical protein